jgi:flagellar hook-associated protein 3 FlgL
MSFQAIGDLAQHYQLRLHTARIKSDLSSLTDALASGLKPDLSASLRGSFGPLAAIERSLHLLDRYTAAGAEAATLATASQTALGRVQAALEAVGPAALSGATLGDATSLATTAVEARNQFAAAVGALNTQAAGVHVFSGRQSDRAPLPMAEQMLADLAALTAGATDAGSVAAIVETYFNDPAGGFRAAYRGTEEPRGALRIGDGIDAGSGPTAADPALRQALQGLATVALLDGAVPGLDAAERKDLAGRGADLLLSGLQPLIAVRADLGVTEARIEEARVANAAETTSLAQARNGLVAADPFEAATALEAVTTQLETLYALTARVSRLSLTNYLG